MSIKNLIKAFDYADRPLGIEIEDIAKEILKLTNNHAIYYCQQPVEKNCKLFGMFEQRERLGAYDDDCGIDNYIHYKVNLAPDYRRLVMGKELIHVLDPDCYLTKTETDVRSLTIDFSTPFFLRGEFPHARHDNSAVTLAVGLFLPLSIREDFINDYNIGKVTSKFIADKIKIPETYVELVMSDVWPDHYAKVFENLEE